MDNEKEIASMKRRIFGVLGMLALEFLLGMTINLFVNSDNGFKGFGAVLLLIHILVGIGLLSGSIFILIFAKKLASKNLAIVGAISIWGAFIAGMLTVATSQSIWSFIMSLGFIIAMLVYGKLVYDIGRIKS